MRLVASLRGSWEKNWPQVHAAMTHGLPEFVLARDPADLGSSVPVFCFHVVDPAAFDADLAFLSRNGYVTIDADSLLAHLERRRAAPRRAVVLTIDDGAHNLYEVAYPLLGRYGMKAVAFVAPAFHRDTEEEPPPGQATARPCTWSEIREMQSSGHVDFQAHTFAHRYVPRWPEPIELAGCHRRVAEARRGDPLPLAEDLRLARTILEAKLRKPVLDLAFPKYRGTPAALELGRAMGYRSFWWGNLPRRAGNRPGESPLSIARLNGDLLRRLPGEQRVRLSSIVRARLRGSAGRMLVQPLAGVRP